MKKNHIYALWLIFLFVLTMTLTIGLAGTAAAGGSCCSYRAAPSCPLDYGHYDSTYTCICAPKAHPDCFHYCSGCGIGPE